MPLLNPGLAKGYALDFASPLRFVAERLSAGPSTLDALCDEYEHDPGDLARVWDHELRGRGQRRSAKAEVRAEREADAKRWLLDAALRALGDQVRERQGRFTLAVPLADVRVGGLPVVIPDRPASREPAAGAAPPAQREARAARRRPAAPAAPPPHGRLRRHRRGPSPHRRRSARGRIATATATRRSPPRSASSHASSPATCAARSRSRASSRSRCGRSSAARRSDQAAARSRGAAIDHMAP